MRVLYKPLLKIGEIRLVTEDEEGSLLCAPYYEITFDDGKAVCFLDKNDFDFVSE